MADKKLIFRQIIWGNEEKDVTLHLQKKTYYYEKNISSNASRGRDSYGGSKENSDEQ